jgi:hypothetical protein
MKSVLDIKNAIEASLPVLKALGVKSISYNIANDKWRLSYTSSGRRKSYWGGYTTTPTTLSVSGATLEAATDKLKGVLKTSIDKVLKDAEKSVSDARKKVAEAEKAAREAEESAAAIKGQFKETKK